MITWQEALRLEPSLASVVRNLVASAQNSPSFDYVTWLQRSSLGGKLAGPRAECAALQQPNAAEMVWATLRYFQDLLRRGHELPDWAKVEPPTITVHYPTERTWDEKARAN